MQLDFFNDSQSVMLRNDVILALQRCDVPAAEQAWDTLAKHHPDDDCLADLLLLTGVLAQRTPVLLQTHADLRSQRLALQNNTTPAARHSLGATEAAPWLRLRWQELAERAAPLPFRAEHVDDHAAPLWLAACQWQAAIDVVSKIESWRRIPAPLSWMLRARLQLQGLQANWGLLAELAWLAPRRLDTVVQQTTEPLLNTLVRKFEAHFEGADDAEDLAWFPAWVLTQRPQELVHLSQAQPGQYSAPEQAMRLLVNLLGLERQGRHHDIVAQRKNLRELNGWLFASYMQTR